jgi:hypothetical protein
VQDSRRDTVANDQDRRDDVSEGDMLGGIARGPIVQPDEDRDLVRDREDESVTSDMPEESTRAEDRDRYGVPDPNRAINVRD